MNQRLVHGALALSVISTALSLYGVVRRPAPEVTAAAGACTCDAADLRRELADLRKAGGAGAPDARLQRLAVRIALLEAKSGVTPRPEDVDDAPAPSTSASAPASGDASAAAAPRDDRPRAYTSFDVPTKAISVHQASDGSVAVTNTDPSMTGKMVTITAKAEDGSTHEIRVTVPPPGQ